MAKKAIDMDPRKPLGAVIQYKITKQFHSVMSKSTAIQCVSREPVRYVFAFDKCPSLDALAPPSPLLPRSPGTTTIKSSFSKFKFKGKKGEKKKRKNIFSPFNI